MGSQIWVYTYLYLHFVGFLFWLLSSLLGWILLCQLFMLMRLWNLSSSFHFFCALLLWTQPLLRFQLSPLCLMTSFQNAHTRMSPDFLIEDVARKSQDSTMTLEKRYTIQVPLIRDSVHSFSVSILFQCSISAYLQWGNQIPLYLLSLVLAYVCCPRITINDTLFILKFTII